MNPLDAIPNAIIPDGVSKYDASIGPSKLLSKGQGITTVTRNAEGITIASQNHGDLRLAPIDDTRVRVSLPNGKQFDGTVSAVGTVTARFTAASGETVTLEREKDRVEVRFAGFSAVVDRMGLFLKMRG